MTALEGQDALIRRLIAMPDAPSFVFPNDPSGAETPRAVIQSGPNAQQTITIGGVTKGVFEIVVRVEVPDGEYTTQAHEIANRIIAQFPYGERFEGITVTEVPYPRPGYSAEGIYHLPVIIRGQGYI